MRAVFLFCLFSASLLRAELLPEAIATFPVNTVSLEYDDLTALRQLPNYKELRQQYSSDALKRVKQTLSMLGILEGQLSEVVTASSFGGFFGLVAGDFSAASAARRAKANSFSPASLGQSTAFCSPEHVCVAFPNQTSGRAEFGSLEQLRAMSAARQGSASALNENSSFTKLLSGLNLKAPVIGFAPGSELAALLKSVISNELSSRLDLSQWAANVESFGYSIRVDTDAHLAATLLCKSETAGKLLSNTLNAASSLQRVAAMAVGNSLSFRNLVATSSGAIVNVKLDTNLAP